MTRFSSFLRRHPFTLALLLVAAVFVAGLVLIQREGEARRTALCEQFNRQQAVIHQLVDVATEGSSAPNLSKLTDLPQFKALDPEDQTFWLIVLNASTGGGQSTTQQRLIDFAKDKLQPADCGSA